MNITSVKRIHQSDWKNNGIKFLRARDIVSIFKKEKIEEYIYISKNKYEEYSKISGKVKKEDLLVTGVGTIGIPLLIENEEPLYFKDGNIIWFQNNSKLNGKFLYYSFLSEKIQNFIKETSGIGTVGTYTIETAKQTPFSITVKEEQEKIGNFFKTFDNLITTHQGKI